MKSTTKTVLILTVVAALLAAGVYGWIHRKPAPEQKQAEVRPAAVVTVAEASTARWPITVRAQGPIAAWREASVGTQVAGLAIVEVRAQEGDRVRRGQLMARLDDRTVKADLQQAQATLSQARATLNQSRLNRDRVLALKDVGAVSQQDILQAETQTETGTAQVASAEAALASMRIRLDDTRVLAPDNGLVASAAATLGQVPGIGTELFRLIRDGRLEWRAQLTAEQFGKVNTGMTATMTLPNGDRATGRVRQMAAALDPQTRLGIAYVDLPPGSSARAAMYANGVLELGMAPAVVVPAAAVVIRDGRASVFKLQGSTVKQAEVQTGRRDGDQVQIDQGVQAGERVVQRGAGFLQDGDTVKVVAADAAASTPAAASAGAPSASPIADARSKP